MCGLFGYELLPGGTPGGKTWRALVRAMADSMDSRGGDSWGYGGERLGGHEIYSRGLGKIATAHVPHECKWLVGHTRFATVGAVKIRNAHPFLYEGKYLAHNGSVYNPEIVGDFPVDSQALLYTLAKGEKTDAIEGYGAVLYGATKLGGIRYIRYDGGSLYHGIVAGERKGHKWGPYRVVSSTVAWANAAPPGAKGTLTEVPKDQVMKGGKETRRAVLAARTFYSTFARSPYMQAERCLFCTGNTYLSPQHHWSICKEKAHWSRPGPRDTWDEVEDAAYATLYSE